MFISIVLFLVLVSPSSLCLFYRVHYFDFLIIVIVDSSILYNRTLHSPSQRELFGGLLEGIYYMLAVKVNPPTQKEEQSQPQQQEEKPRNETAIMGTTFSSTSSSSTSQSLRNESRDETSTMQVDCSSSSSDNKPNSSSTSTATSSSSSRKRKRNEISSDSSSSSSSSDAAKASSTSTKVQTKKPKKETIWSRYFSSTWNSFTDSFTCCFSKVFLLGRSFHSYHASSFL